MVPNNYAIFIFGMIVEKIFSISLSLEWYSAFTAISQSIEN